MQMVWNCCSSQSVEPCDIVLSEMNVSECVVHPKDEL
jgi:hypothetical protein